MDDVATGALICEGRLLLAHRNAGKRAHPDVWALPGGVVEPGETDAEALARELAEELGVRIEPSSVSLLARVEGGPASEPAMIAVWLVREWSGTPTNLAPDEHDDLAWVDRDDLPPFAPDAARASVLAALRAG